MHTHTHHHHHPTHTHTPTFTQAPSPSSSSPCPAAACRAWVCTCRNDNYHSCSHVSPGAYQPCDSCTTCTCPVASKGVGSGAPRAGGGTCSALGRGGGSGLGTGAVKNIAWGAHVAAYCALSGGIDCLKASVLLSASSFCFAAPEYQGRTLNTSFRGNST